jgi:hypothetical protein
MQRLWYWRPLAAALFVCLAVPGCGGSRHAVAGGSRSAPVTGNQSPTATGGASAATGGGNVPGGPQAHGAAEAKGAPLGNAGNGGGGGPTAPGAPITIPDVIVGQGASVDDVRNSLVTGAPLPGEPNSYKGINAQCGGKLCVTIAVKPGSSADDAGSFTECQYLGKTDLPAGSVVHPGDTIWILTGAQSCTSSSGSGQSSSQASDQSSSPASGQSSAPGTDQSSAPAADQSSTDTSSP